MASEFLPVVETTTTVFKAISLRGLRICPALFRQFSQLVCKQQVRFKFCINLQSGTGFAYTEIGIKQARMESRIHNTLKHTAVNERAFFFRKRRSKVVEDLSRSASGADGPTTEQMAMSVRLDESSVFVAERKDLRLNLKEK